MFETIIEHEPSIRLAFFFGTAGLVGLWQTLRPRRPSGSSRPFRWLNNFGITFLNTLLLRLWRFHKMHHADVDFDVSTGVRFHPVEIILSMLIKLLVVLLLGPPVVAVIIFEVILSSLALFNHANAGLPPRLDSIVRKFIVTPDMHRVHHSVIRAEHDSNFGFNLACWDYLFGTYRATPAAGHDGMTIGLTDYQENRRQNLLWMLALPFRRGQQTSR
mgnify:CR=1 FL=1